MGTGNSAGLKRPGCEADLSTPFNVEVKNSWSYSSTSLNSFLTWCSSTSPVHHTVVCDASLVEMSLPVYFISRELSLLWKVCDLWWNALFLARLKCYCTCIPITWLLKKAFNPRNNNRSSAGFRYPFQSQPFCPPLVECAAILSPARWVSVLFASPSVCAKTECSTPSHC
jgi:hypothetical protein